MAMESDNWLEVDSPDGRIFYFDRSTGLSQWEKPSELKTAAERSLEGLPWREYKIWDGRSFFYNDEAKLSVWATPPEIQLAYDSVVGASTDEVMTPEAEAPSIASIRSDYFELLEEMHSRGTVSDGASYDEVRPALIPDDRFNLIVSEEARRQAYGEYCYLRLRRQEQERRSLEKLLVRDLVIWLQSVEGISEASSFESVFKNQCEWTKLPETRVRHIFENYLADLARVRARDDRKRDDLHMGQLKAAILAHPSTDFAAPFNSLSLIFSGSASWDALEEDKRLAVWRTCVSQYVRGVRASISAGEGMRRRARECRKKRDIWRNRLLDWFEGWAGRNAGEELWLIQSPDLIKTLKTSFDDLPQLEPPGLTETELVDNFLINLRDGKPPFADVPEPKLPQSP